MRQSVKEVPEAEAQVGKWLDCRARITSKEHAPLHSGKSALMRVAKLNKSLAKGPKNGDKSAVAMLKKNEHLHRTGRPVVNVYSSKTRQLGCVFQDMEPPKSSSILRKSSDIRKPIRCVKFTNAVVRHADIRDQNPSLGMICPGEPHQRNPNAPKFEDRSQKETEWQEQGAREVAWRLAKNILKLKEKHTTAFFSPSENRCLPASNSDQRKNVLELSDLGIHQKMSKPDYQRLKTIVKRSIQQKLRLRNFDARNERIETGAVVKKHRSQRGVERGKGICYQWKP